MATVEADEVARFLAAVKDARQHGLDKSAALAYAVLESKSETLARYAWEEREAERAARVAARISCDSA